MSEPKFFCDGCLPRGNLNGRAFAAVKKKIGSSPPPPELLRHSAAAAESPQDSGLGAGAYQGSPRDGVPAAQCHLYRG